ncbi:Crp/Fnr family transcriptional regulator [Colwelliaceae bacterium 6441]
MKETLASSERTCDKNHKYIVCSQCAMQPICKPVQREQTSLNISDNYLSKRIDSSTNEVLFAQNQPLTAIYAVCSGAYKLTQCNRLNEEKIVGFRFPGELIGEDAIHPKAYAYNAIALNESSVCKVNIKELKACSQVVPDLQLSLIDLLTKQSAMSQSQFQSFIAKKTAESLIAAFILNIIQRKSVYDHQGGEVKLTISRDNIANFLGLRRETLSRIISKFQKERYIKQSGKQLSILNKNALIALANL